MHAYLIIAHNQFELLNKLLRALDYNDNDIYIHIDSKSGSINKSEITKGVVCSNVFFAERMNIVWGEFSQIECELRLFSMAAKKDYEYVHLISGVDFPIKSQKYIHDFFNKNKGKEFVHFEGKILPKEDREKVNCYFPLQRYIGNKKKDKSFLYIIQRIIVNTQKVLKINRHKNDNIIFYKGANWVSVTGDFVKYLTQNQDNIHKIYKNSMCCDEIFLHTLLMNSPFKDNLYDKSFNNDYRMCMRYIDWNRGGPYTFKNEDYDELMASDMLFARKFDYYLDSQIIDRIYSTVKGIEDK